MKKFYNYLSYCIYSFIPLYLVLLVYTLIKRDIDDILLSLVLILYSIFSVVLLSYSKPTNIVVFSKKELTKQRGIDYVYLVMMIIITFLVINEKLNILFKILVLIIIFLIFYITNFKFKSYLLTILGYKMYIIRDKIVYSKKEEDEIYLALKEKKFLQVVEVSNGIYVENEKYGMMNFYCKDFS